MAPRLPTDEVEAKLLAPDEATLASIAGCTAIGQFSVEALATSHLTTTYLDTANRDLLANRVALRVRQVPTGWEMTAKWAGSVSRGVHTRPELNIPLERAPGPPYSLPPGPLRDRLAPIITGHELEPFVVTRITRSLAHIREPSGTIVAELALDRVQHSAPGSTKNCAPYFEVEVELIDGPGSVIGEIAALLCSSFPLEPSRGSKLSRAIKELYGPEILPTWET